VSGQSLRQPGDEYAGMRIARAVAVNCLHLETRHMLSLYRALFNYEFGKRADQLRHFMLLYSKYSEGLVSIANMPQLTLRAIRMRNLLT
jgi:hypothetical protein